MRIGKHPPEIIFTDEGIDLRPTHRTAAENLIEEFMVLANRLVADYFEAHNIPSLYRVQAQRLTMASYNPAVSRHAELGLQRYMHFILILNKKCKLQGRVVQ